MKTLSILMTVTLWGCASTQEAPKTKTAETAKPPPAPAAKPEVREGRWEIRGTRLFVRDVGPRDAPVLIVVHGGPGGNHISLRRLEALAPAHRVVLYDQRGTGESDRLDVSPARPKSLEKLTLEQNVEDLEALRERLGREKVSLIGHSWGAALVVFYAAAYPARVDRLIVYSGGPETLELAKRKKAAHRAKLTAEERAMFKQRLEAIQTAVKADAPQEKLDPLFVKLASVMFPSLYCVRPGKGESGYGEIGRGGFWANQVVGQYVDKFQYASIADGLRRVKAPALLTWGRCEPSPVERLTNLLDYLPDARFVVFKKSGHNAMEEEEELFFGMLRAFLAGKPIPTPSYRSRKELPVDLTGK
jgi:proline iminopeptidase